MYALPKTHKEGCPLRPIVSSMKSPTYKLAKFMASILKCKTNNSKFNVVNSQRFKQLVTAVPIEPSDVMVSFDVVSLFSNVPTALCIKTVEKRWDEINKCTKTPKKLFLDILKLCTYESNYFAFDGTIYKQTLGLPMGSPLSPILADIVMEELLTISVGKLPYTPKLMTKYVDDIFAILPRQHIETTLGILNSFHEKIQFTVEVETNGKLPYLDVENIRNNGSIITNWYKKPTAPGRILNYRSYHQKTQILNTAGNFIQTILELSHERFYRRNIKSIYSTLTQNGFPTKTIKNLIHKQEQKNKQKGKERTRADGNTTTNDKNNRRFFGTNYIPRLSERRGGLFRKYNKEIFLAYRAHKTVKYCYSSIKDRTPKDQNCDVVYSIPCKGNNQDNCDAKYVGTTGQTLKNRISGHRSDLKGKNVQKTALTEHCAKFGHVPDFDKVQVLCHERNYHKRMTLESLYICRTDGAINKRTDTDGVSAAYCALIKN